MKAGRADAEYSARLLGSVNPLSIKHTVEDEAALERTHPTFFPLIEQWEQHTQAIQQLRTGEAFIRLPNDSVHRVHTPTLAQVSVSATQLQAVRQHYLHRYFRPLPHPPAPAAPPPVPSPGPTAVFWPQPVRRFHPGEPARRNEHHHLTARRPSRVVPHSAD